MKFSSRRDVEAPPETVFESLSNFAVAERVARSRGIRVTRHPGTPPEAARWTIEYRLRGRSRQLEAHVASFTPPEGFIIEGGSEGVSLRLDVEVIALARARSRIVIGIDLRPKTLPARILVQSMKLTKPALSRKLDARINEIATRIEQRHRATT